MWDGRGSAVHVTLIRPPTLLPSSCTTTTQGVPPLSLACLAGSLRQAGHRVEIIDAFGCAPDQFLPFGAGRYFINGLTAEQIAERVPADCELVGVSCMFSNEWLYYREVIDRVAAARPELPIVVGGEHVTADPDYVLRRCPAIAYCGLGECDETLVELVAALEAGSPVANVPGLAYRGADGAPRRSRPRGRIRDIDALPWPSWDGIPLRMYLDRELGNEAAAGRCMPMLASRGCPYRCTFCSNPNMYGTTWVARDPALVVQEIEHYVRTYAIDHVEFYDLTTIIRRDWIVSFCKLMIERNPRVTWGLPSGTRSEALDREVLQLLERSGCRSLTYAPESGSPATLRRIKKRIDPEKMLRSMRWAVRSGIRVRANMIVGLPGQTPREIFESLVFVLRMAWAGVHDVLIFPFVPYPGSELHAQLAAQGRFNFATDDYEEFLAGNIYNDVERVRSWNEYLSARAVARISVAGMLLFYAVQFLLRPARIVRTAARLLRGWPLTNFERIVMTFLRTKLGRGRYSRSIARARRVKTALDVSHSTP